MIFVLSGRVNLTPLQSQLKGGASLWREISGSEKNGWKSARNEQIDNIHRMLYEI